MKKEEILERIKKQRKVCSDAARAAKAQYEEYEAIKSELVQFSDIQVGDKVVVDGKHPGIVSKIRVVTPPTLQEDTFRFFVNKIKKNGEMSAHKLNGLLSLPRDRVEKVEE